MRCHSVAYGTEVLDDNFSCTWTLCSKQSGDGWPQRSQLQPGVPSLGRCVTLLPATFCNLGLRDPLSSCNKRICFHQLLFFAWQTYGRNDLKLRLDETVVGQTNSNGQVTFQHVGPPCVGAIAFLVTNAEARPARTFDRTQGILTNYVIPLP